MTNWRDSPAAPRASLIICTRDRPQLLQRAIRAGIAQDYEGPLEIVIVFDQSEPHEIDIAFPDGRTLVTTKNHNTPGLAGARNTGLATATGDIVGFCDDDDEWLPDKLRRQVALMRGVPEAVAIGTGMSIVTEDGAFPREAPARATHADFIRSRTPTINSSNTLYERRVLVDIGGVDENLPYGYGEDYDVFLRITRAGDIWSVPEPLVNIYWNRPSFFADRWRGIAEGLSYILDKYSDDFATDRIGRGHIRGQVAFAYSALGNRREAVRWALRSIRDSPRQLRGYAALAISARLASPERLVRMVQARGKGL